MKIAPAKLKRRPKPFVVVVHEGDLRGMCASSMSMSTDDPVVRVKIDLKGVPHTKVVDAVHDAFRPLAAAIATQWLA